MAIESISFRLKQIDGTHDLKEIKRELDAFPGVHSVSVNPQDNHISVDYDTTGVNGRMLESRLLNMGYQIDCYRN